ncbi:MAG: hypothetical protein JO069_11590, partial [Verrucomicrobia bacterium]|nr:hypothetical protein [Verrucomicrobiota bacterium]
SSAVFISAKNTTKSPIRIGFKPVAQPNEKPWELPVLPFPEWVDYPAQTLIYDHFPGNQLSAAWSWVREPAPDSFGVADGTFRFNTQSADLYVDSNNASVLTRPLPPGDRCRPAI